MIRLGAIRIVVPGNFRFGCFPIFLTSFSSLAFDDLGCLTALNELAVFQNSCLQGALGSLGNILTLSYSADFLSVVRRATFLGFDQRSLLKTCCGIGEPYNNNGNRSCGSPGVPVCPNPAQYIHWDGIHWTQEAYRHIPEILISDILSKIQCVW
ncbi:hypothetical protein F0562_032261 [Nyssa sinensis]|uniref:GDSL esterase/lipase n=1 Tax=Nyssa sinensis TaxID=561372 RepID=A0A5J5API4_9ASTE|nr:hypothetical protein F0562_032261 [Nyssa sinensis]